MINGIPGIKNPRAPTSSRRALTPSLVLDKPTRGHWQKIFAGHFSQYQCFPNSYIREEVPANGLLDRPIFPAAPMFRGGGCCDQGGAQLTLYLSPRQRIFSQFKPDKS